MTQRSQVRLLFLGRTKTEALIDSNSFSKLQNFIKKVKENLGGNWVPPVLPKPFL